MKYKTCRACGKHVRENEVRCWNCQSVEFQTMPTVDPEPAAPLRLIDKVKGHVATAKAIHERRKQNAADEKQRQEEAEAERQRHLARERKAAFDEARQTSPFPLTLEKVSIAGGLELFNDEFVVSVAREWGGLSTQKLTLTTHRILYSIGVLRTDQKSLYLTDIRDVRYHKPFIGQASISFETAGGKSIEGLPAVANGAKVRDQLMAMIHWARQRGAQPIAPPVASSAEARRAPDRLEQLRQLGELKTQGILSEEEFLTEKTKILSSSSRS